MASCPLAGPVAGPVITAGNAQVDAPPRVMEQDPDGISFFANRPLTWLATAPALSASRFPPDRPRQMSAVNPPELSQPLADALIRGQRERARGYLQQALALGYGVTRIGDCLIAPAMSRIGDLWSENRISVSQEHLASALVESLLSELLTGAGFQPSRGRVALFAAVGSAGHVLGLRVVADAFELAGWDTQLLGARIDPGRLVRAVFARRARLLGLSVGLPSQHADVARTITAVRAHLGDDAPTILLGGSLGGDDPDGLAATLGADAWCASAGEAVRRFG